MNEEDQMLCAWLKKRGYRAEPSGDKVQLTQLSALSVKLCEPITDRHLNMWVNANAGQRPYLVLLYSRQGKGRRPLRSLVREWVIGL